MTEPKPPKSPKSKAAIYWPTALVLTIAIVGAVLIAVLAPADSRTELLVAYTALVATVLAVMRALFEGRGGTALVLLAALGTAHLMGCAGVSETYVARSTLATTARVMARVDHELAAQRIEIAQSVAARPTATAADFDNAMAPFDEALLVSMDIRDSQLAAQAALDAADRGEASDWPALLGCVALGVDRILAIARRHRIELPEEARRLVEPILAAGASACPTGGAS